MDEETLGRIVEALRGVVREEIDKALAARRVDPGRRYTISDRAKDQRQAAAQRSAQVRSTKFQRNKSTKSQRKSRAKTTASTDSVERNPTKSNGKLSTEKPTDGAAGEGPITEGSKLWLAYAAAYRLRYGIFPPRNAKVNAQLKHFLERVPAADAGAIAEHYLGLDERLYVNSAHCVDLMLRDAEKLYMSAKTGRKVVEGGGKNGYDHPQVKPWWETWPGIEKMGAQFAIVQGDNPTIFKGEVLRAAALTGELPVDIARKMGLTTLDE
jgi:hypothetical protein